MDYDETIQKCPNLMCFTLKCSQHAIDRDHGDMKRYNVFSMQPHLKFKKLMIEMVPRQDTIDYIMHKFPNLECCNVHLSVNKDLLDRIEPWITSHYEEKLRKFQEYLSNRRYGWFFTHASFPLIEEYLQRTTNPIVRISSTEQYFPWFHMQQDNIIWIIRNAVANIDILKELFKRYQNGTKEAYLDTSNGFGERRLIDNLFWKCKGLEKFTYKKATISYLESEFPDPRCVLSPSLITLKLIAAYLQQEALSVYSRALPKLRNLTIAASYRFFDSPSFIVNMPKTKFNHLKVYVDIGLPTKNKHDKPVLLEILSKKSCQKQFLANATLSNQLEEFSMATNKEYGYIIAIKCASIDFISISFNESHILKEYPLSL